MTDDTSFQLTIDEDLEPFEDWMLRVGKEQYDPDQDDPQPETEAQG